MTAPAEHPYQTSTPAATPGEPGSPPVGPTPGLAPNIIADSSSTGVPYDTGD
jgi:hypothetical protein